MRKFFTIIATMMLWTVSLFAKVPLCFDYQEVVCDADGKVITNQELGVQVSILQGSVDGTSVYRETHTTTATASGAINLEIGGGKTSDDFSAIDWSKGPYFIQSTTEVNGKSVTVTSQLLSVPYAQYAEKVSDAYLEAKLQSILAASGATFTPSTLVEVKKENGVLPGKFSVSDTKKVQFAMGNLQYQASTKKWRFAENQYDVIDYENKISPPPIVDGLTSSGTEHQEILPNPTKPVRSIPIIHRLTSSEQATIGASSTPSPTEATRLVFGVR